MKPLIFGTLLVFALHNLNAEEVKVHKGNIKVEALVESRARDVSQEVIIDSEVNRYRTTAYTNRILLRAATMLFGRLELFGDFGGADLSAPAFDDFDSSIRLAYGGGFNLTMFESRYRGHARAFMGARYTQYQAHEDTVNTEIDTRLVAVNEEILWKEWNGELGFGWLVGSLSLEAGIRLSFIDSRDRLFDRDSGERLVSLPIDEDDNVGLFVRTDIFLDPEQRFAINIGITTIDVNSIHAGLKVWF